jgi:hypothetical protein
VWRGLFYAGSDTSYHYFVDVNEPFSASISRERRREAKQDLGK